MKLFSVVALFSVLTISCVEVHASFEEDCYDFRAFPPGADFDSGTNFHQAVDSFSTFDSDHAFMVVHEGVGPMAWIDTLQRTNACAGEFGALSFVSHAQGGLNRAEQKWRGFSIKFKPGNHQDYFKMAIADLGDWDPKKLVSGGSKKNRKGVVRVCGYAEWGDTTPLTCQKLYLAPKGKGNDGCQSTNHAEVRSNIGAFKEVRTFFEVESPDGQVLYDWAYDPNFGITRVCWPKADKPDEAVVLDDQYTLDTDQDNIIVTEVGEGLINVTLSNRPIGSSIIAIGATPGLEYSPCELHLDRHNWDSGSILSYRVTDDSSDQHFQLHATNLDDPDQNGLSKSVTLSATDLSLTGELYTCNGWGDPHFTTFDGKKHNNQVPGTQYWVKTADNRLTIQGSQTKCGKAACTIGLAVQFKNAYAQVAVSRGGIAIPTVLTPETNDIVIHISEDKRNVEILLEGEGSISIKVRWSKMLQADILRQIDVNLPIYYRGKVDGMCGNWDGNKSNDPDHFPNKSAKRTFWDNIETHKLSVYSRVEEHDDLFGYPITGTTWDAPKAQRVSFRHCHKPEDPDDVTDQLPDSVDRLPVDDDMPELPDCFFEEFTGERDGSACDVFADLIDTGHFTFEQVEQQWSGCVEDMCLTGDSDTSFAADALEDLQSNIEDDLDNILECHLNCNYNGDCVNGACICEDGWFGDACGRPDRANEPLAIVSSNPDNLSHPDDLEHWSFSLSLAGVDGRENLQCWYREASELDMENWKQGLARVLALGVIECTIPRNSFEPWIDLKVLDTNTNREDEIRLGADIEGVHFVVDCHAGRYYVCTNDACYTKERNDPWRMMITAAAQPFYAQLIGITANQELIVKMYGSSQYSETTDLGSTISPHDFDPNDAPDGFVHSADLNADTTIDWLSGQNVCYEGKFSPEHPEQGRYGDCEYSNGIWSFGVHDNQVYWCATLSTGICATMPQDRLNSDDSGNLDGYVVIQRADLPSELTMWQSTDADPWNYPVKRHTFNDVETWADNSGVYFTVNGLTTGYSWCCTSTCE